MLIEFVDMHDVAPPVHMKFLFVMQSLDSVITISLNQTVGVTLGKRRKATWKHRKPVHLKLQ